MVESVSKKLGLPPDILEGSTIIKSYGDQCVIIENYKSLIEYTENVVKIQGKHMKIMVEGNDLYIERFEPDECKVCGKICGISYVRF